MSLIRANRILNLIKIVRTKIPTAVIRLSPHDFIPLNKEEDFCVEIIANGKYAAISYYNSLFGISEMTAYTGFSNHHEHYLRCINLAAGTIIEILER